MKNTKQILIMLVLIFGINACTTPSASEKLLLGKWVLVAETDSFNDIEPLEVGDSSHNADTGTVPKNVIIFNEDKTIFINQGGNEYNSTYQLSDSILTLGFREYILIEIDENKLVYKDRDGLFNKHYEFKKDQ